MSTRVVTVSDRLNVLRMARMVDAALSEVAEVSQEERERAHAAAREYLRDEGLVITGQVTA